MAIYKVSYVIIGNDNLGMILNQTSLPQKGDRVKLRNKMFEIIEVLELVPPRGDFYYIHATCRSLPKAKK